MDKQFPTALTFATFSSIFQLKVTVLKLKNLLIKHNIHVPRVPPQFLPSKNDADCDGEAEEMSDNSDGKA